MVQRRVRFGELVALALARHHMQELRPFQIADVLQGRDQRIQIVPVNRADVVEAEFFEQGAGRDQSLDVLFHLAGDRGAEHFFAGAASRSIGAPGEHAREDLGQRAHRRRDRHFVVVEDYQQAGIAHTGVVQCLEGHAGRHGAVADHRDGVAVLAFLLRRNRHAECGRDRGGRVCGAEGVVLALAAAREAGNAVVLAQRVHALAPPGEDLVRVGLVANIPDDAVVRGVEHIVQRDGQFYRTQVGRQMAAGARHRFDQEGAQFIAQLRQLLAVKQAQLCRRIDGFQQRIGAHGHGLVL